jgi:hypothetical protein
VIEVEQAAEPLASFDRAFVFAGLGVISISSFPRP